MNGHEGDKFMCDSDSTLSKYSIYENSLSLVITICVGKKQSVPIGVHDNNNNFGAEIILFNFARGVTSDSQLTTHNK